MCRLFLIFRLDFFISFVVVLFSFVVVFLFRAWRSLYRARVCLFTWEFFLFCFSCFVTRRRVPRWETTICKWHAYVFALPRTSPHDARTSEHASSPFQCHSLLSSLPFFFPPVMCMACLSFFFFVICAILLSPVYVSLSLRDVRHAPRVNRVKLEAQQCVRVFVFISFADPRV